MADGESAIETGLADQARTNCGWYRKKAEEILSEVLQFATTLDG